MNFGLDDIEPWRDEVRIYREDELIAGNDVITRITYGHGFVDIRVSTEEIPVMRCGLCSEEICDDSDLDLRGNE